MIALMQSLSTFAGLISIILMLFVSIIAGRYMARSGIESATSEAQKNALDAMQAEILVLRGKIDDLRRENQDIRKDGTRLQFIMETVQAALKNKGIVVTIDGEMVIISDKDNSITTRIHGADNGR